MNLMDLQNHPMYSMPPFNENTAESQALKTRHEAEEFAAEPSLSEAADVVICILGWLRLSELNANHLLGEIKRKLDINARRTWVRQPDGSLQHVEPEAVQA